MRILTPFFLSLAVAAWAQRADPGFDPMKDVALGFEQGAVVVTIPTGTHLKASFMGIAKKAGPGTLNIGKLPPTTAKDELGDGIWHGTVKVPVSGEGLSGTVTLQVTYQPCTEGEGGVCYPPTTKPLAVKASDIPAAKPAGLPIEKDKEMPKAEAAPPATPSVSLAQTATSAPVPHTSLLLSLLLVFLAGMGASLTPCVFPMIPITMAIIGAKGGGKARGFALSCMLVIGMAVTYTTLGVVAAKSGAVFGAATQKPAFLIPMALLFVAFALSLFGAYEIALPPRLAARLQGDGNRKGYGGAFLMGLVLGPLSAPCVGPVIGTVLLGIAQQGEVFSGALQLFVFALGMGLLFMVVGTFSAALPRSGEWLTRFKRILGLVVLGFAVWSIRLIVPPWLLLAFMALLQLIGAAVFGAFEPADGFLAQLRKGFGILLLVLGILHWVRASEVLFNAALLPGSSRIVEGEPAPKGWLEQDLEGALAKAKAEHKLVLVDIYAEWCAQCKELDEKTWSDASVKQWIAQNAVAVRIDTDARRKDLAAQLQIRSYPTVLLLDAEGRELRRILGFQKAEAMKTWLEGK